MSESEGEGRGKGMGENHKKCDRTHRVFIIQFYPPFNRARPEYFRKSLRARKGILERENCTHAERRRDKKKEEGRFNPGTSRAFLFVPYITYLTALGVGKPGVPPNARSSISLAHESLSRRQRREMNPVDPFQVGEACPGP